MSSTLLDTEERIKLAAKKIFQKKGFAATRTRDIAEEADINLALLNYYFRSKKKLYDLVMMEILQSFFGGTLNILNSAKTTISEKVTLFVNHYIDLLTENPEMAGFIMNSKMENPDLFLQKIGVVNQLKNSYFFQQIQDAMEAGDIPKTNPKQIIINMMSLTVFPFIAQPMISSIFDMENEDFLNLIEERRKAIPTWIQTLFQLP